MTILATIGILFIIACDYIKGKKDGIKEATDYFVTEMNKRKIAIEDIKKINGYDNMKKKKVTKILKNIPPNTEEIKWERIMRKKK